MSPHEPAPVPLQGLTPRKFTSDWFGNLGSLGVLGVSGILLNTLIVRFYGDAALGTFSEVLAIFLVVAQLATLGIQYSILQASAAQGITDTELPSILLSGLLPVAASGIAIAAVTAAAGWKLRGGPFGPALLLASPGVAFYALNKCLLSFLNGIHRNQAFAALSALRPVTMLGAVVALFLAGGAAWMAPVSLSVEETVVFAVALATVASGRDLHNGTISFLWMRRHLDFGWRTMLGGIAIETNMRADILILALFASATEVGIYSFAVSVIEGLLQIPQITRRIIDPICAWLVVQNRHDELAKLSRTVLGLSALGAVVIGATAVAAYPVAVRVLLDASHVNQQWLVFSILMVGTVLSASYTGFSGYLIQSAKPGIQTRLECVLLGVNALGCLFLAPSFGMYGVAVAKSVALGSQALGLRLLLRRYLGLRL